MYLCNKLNLVHVHVHDVDVHVHDIVDTLTDADSMEINQIG